MGIRNRAIAVLATVTLLSGCFGYNRSAKRWSYVGDTVLLLAGGAAIAVDVTNKPQACMDTTTMPCPYESPVGGAMVAGVVLAAAGLFGMIFNATRPIVKTSR
jgi:hypothetical protein